MEAAQMNDKAMFARDGDRFMPTLASQGPWDPTLLHGGPVAGLLARETERADVPEAMRIGRMTIDLLRPVPFEPLEMRHEIVRQGRQIALVDASMWWGEKLVARSNSVFVRADQRIRSSARKRIAGEGPPIPGRDHGGHDIFGKSALEGVQVPGFSQSVQVLRVVGEMHSGAPAIVWTTLRLPLVEDEATSPFQSLACLGDFTSGLGNYVNMLRYSSPNADLTYNLVRYPKGEWLGFDAASVVGNDGLGQSRARMFDEDGFVGTGSATLVISPRPDPDG